GGGNRKSSPARQHWKLVGNYLLNDDRPSCDPRLNNVHKIIEDYSLGCDPGPPASGNSRANLSKSLVIGCSPGRRSALNCASQFRTCVITSRKFSLCAAISCPEISERNF